MGILPLLVLLQNKMSMAEKTWPAERRTRMEQIRQTNPGPGKSLAGKPLAGKVALVTGGNRGIGRAIALRLAALGADLAICGRDISALGKASDELRRLGVRLHSQRADVTRSAEVDALVRQTEATLGPISILVNNAGMGLFGSAHEKTEQEWDTLMNTNLKSVFLVSRAVVPGMIERQSGDIINISSQAGKSTFAG